MTGVFKIEIAESVEQLKSLMKQQKTGIGYAKVQSLYLLKIKAVETINHLAIIIGRGESTIHRWLKSYREGGIEELLEEPPKTGRRKKLDIETVAYLQKELSNPEGFSSYSEVKLWLYVGKDIEIAYSTIHKIVRYELQAKLKVPRPRHEKQAPGVVKVFKEYLPVRIRGLVDDIQKKRGKNQKIVYWCQDETRLGFRTELGKKLTGKGVKPQQTFQWHYHYYYIYGLVEPMGGRSFFWEFSHFNSECFELYLQQFSQEYCQEIHIIQLDNAPSHTAKKLAVPDNVILLFQPPYSPEVNPIERVWEFLKYQLKNLWIASLDELKEKVASLLSTLSNEVIHSLTSWQHIVKALSLSLL